MSTRIVAQNEAVTPVGKNNSVLSIETSVPPELLLAAVNLAIALEKAEQQRPRHCSELWCFTHKICSQKLLAKLDDRQATLAVRKTLAMITKDNRDPFKATFPTYEEPEETFRRQRSRVLYPDGIPQEAMTLAKLQPYPINDDRSANYRLLVSICYWLQRLVGDGTILVPVELWGKKMGLKPITISTLRANIEGDGYLLETMPYVKGKRATKFRFIGPDPWLKSPD